MKIKVGVIFGGESVEHEVSIITAVQAMDYMDDVKYDVVPIYITKTRDWYTGKQLRGMDIYKDIEKLKKTCKQVTLEKINNNIVLMRKKGFNRLMENLDIIFPIMHGTNGEDGSIQGYLEMIGAPYVGCNVYGAAVGQDKVFQKQILKQEEIPITNYTWFFDSEYYEKENEVLNKINKLKYPLIVKPARLGSSVGITIAKTKKDIKEAIEVALEYDYKISVEEVVQNLVELNVSITGSYNNMQISEIEEVMGKDEILSYKDKYLVEGSKTKGMESTCRVIPARIDKKVKDQITNLAFNAFKVLNASGTSRIDFLLDKKTNKLYLNEINTIPGCLSFYLWEPAGKPYKQLLTEMIEEGINTYTKRTKRTFSFETNILSTFNGSKGMKGKLKKHS